MSLISTYRLMAQYNLSMNQRIYTSASQLSADQLNEDRGAFFGSILGTLNHILVGDIIWLKRFAGHPVNMESLESVQRLPKPQSLNEIVHPHIDLLFSAREALDKTICLFAGELTDDIVLSPLTYTNTKGNVFTKQMGYLIQHLFNHQTHHRGQVSTLLSQAGVDIGVTDLLANIPEE